MVRVNECCCGCSLRTGTLILLWMTLSDGFYGFYAWVQTSRIFDKQLRNDDLLFAITSFAFLAIPITGFITAIYGINGIYRNIAEYLTPQLYFMSFKVVLTIFFIPIVLQYPIVFSILLGESPTREVPAYYRLLVFTILLVVQAYFLVVVKSWQDSMRETTVAECSIPCLDAPPPYSEV